MQWGLLFYALRNYLLRKTNHHFGGIFFGLSPSEDPTENDPPLDSDTDSVTEKPVVEEGLAKPEPLDPGVSHKGIVEAPSTKSVVKEESLVKPEPSDLGVSHKGIVEEPSTKSAVKEENLTESLPMAPIILNKDMVGVPSRDKKQSIDAGNFRDPFLLLREGRSTQKSSKARGNRGWSSV